VITAEATDIAGAAEATDIAGAAEEADRFRIQLGGAAGASERHPWQELAGGGSIVRRTSRLAARAGIDVHIVAPRRPPTAW